MARHFVSEAIRQNGDSLFAAAFGTGEPPLPARFAWRDEDLVVAAVERTWRSTNEDRGDTYLARHWFDVRLADGRGATLYFDRKARRSAPNWWLYALSDAPERDEKPG
ncbi:MAG: hypothetical protein IAI48_05485 [Candidatus Eremiobacteraeota bacterium]|nr:hypothetical protein [Candidatus Eremiobacteraeota bacterium]